MSFVTKDGFWIELDDEHEFIVPLRGQRSKLNIFDDCSNLTQKELQKIIEDALEGSGLKNDE